MSEKAAIVLKSEERRALVLLGATAVIATIWAALWTTAKSPQDVVWNFPTGPLLKHLTIYVIPTLQYFIEFFMGYASSRYCEEKKGSAGQILGQAGRFVP